MNTLTQTPTAVIFLDTLKLCSHKLLLQNGFLHFQKTNLGDLYLYPVSWQSKLPDGLQVTDIFYQTYTFEKGLTEIHHFEGHLNYGFIKPLGV